MGINHRKFETSSDEEDLAPFKAVAVSFEDLTKKRGDKSSKIDGEREGRRTKATSTAEEGEESLPEHFQQTLRKALEQRLDTAFEQKLGTSAVLQNTPTPGEDEDSSSKVQLFRTTPRTAKFKAQEINRKLQPQQHKAPLQRIGQGRPPVDDEDETELLRKAEAAAVNGESILQHAASAALIAQKNIALPESSGSGLDDSCQVGTVTRVLRAFKAVSSLAPAKRKKAAGKQKHEEHRDGPNSKPSEQPVGDRVIATGPGEGSENLDRHRSNEEAGISEEERRARKRAKKLRQKQQHKDDAEHRAKEKIKREKKRARTKAAKQSTEPNENITG